MLINIKGYAKPIEINSKRSFRLKNEKKKSHV
jgi:hypothetical protein